MDAHAAFFFGFAGYSSPRLMGAAYTQQGAEGGSGGGYREEIREETPRGRTQCQHINAQTETEPIKEHLNATARRSF